jgi:putative transposase
MPRQRRLILPDVAAHVIQRGNDRHACFREPTDYMVYLVTLRDLAAKHQCTVHAYCLMTNHVHLLLTPHSGEGCTGLMRDLGQRFVQYFNRRHDRTGTLWEGRFRSSVVESARYVLACYRYIELNPVRAGLVRDAADYPWSSHGVNIGQAPKTFLMPHAEFAALGSSALACESAYRRLFDIDIESTVIREIREATNGGYPLAGETFKAHLKSIAPRKVERGRAGRPSKGSEGSDESKSGSDPDLFEIGL